MTTETTVTGVMVRVADAEPPFAVPEIDAVAVEATGIVETVKVAEVAPAATVTVAGTVALALLLDNDTTSPPTGAALPMVTVPVELEPPTTEVGFTLTAVTRGAVTVSDAVLEIAFAVPVIVAVVSAATAVVVTVKVFVVAPEGTVTLAGTVTPVLLLDNETTKPAAGAGESRVIVPVEDVPPTTEVGATATEVSFGAVTVRVPGTEAPLSVAVTVPFVSEATASVVAVKVAVVAPAATVTEAGT